MAHHKRSSKRTGKSSTMTATKTPNPRQQVYVQRAPMMRGRYDAAQTVDENSRHWAYADGLSADAAMSTTVRTILRNRARYEVANNSYASGIVGTLAHSSIGTGPRLQLLAATEDENNAVEAEFSAWAEAVDLAGKLRTMRKAKAQDGEAFAVLTRNPELSTPVKLDLRLVEADHITTPAAKVLTDPRFVVDGIEFDSYGNRKRYWMLPVHPGSVGRTAQDPIPVPAKSMLHWYRVDRPGQNRGVPELTPALPLFAQLRRYTLAVLAAAETAADFAAVIYTDTPANSEAANVAPMTVVELEARMATVLPEGWKLGQMKAEQPITGYGEFKREILSEIAWGLHITFNVAAGDSSKHNYASGRLDWQMFAKDVRVERRHCAHSCLDRILYAWFAEAILISDYLSLLWRMMRHIPHQWFWDGDEHVDPQKEAKAQDTHLKNYSTNYANEYAKQGKDWRKELEQCAIEKAFMDSKGLKQEDVEKYREAAKTRREEADDD